MYPGDYEAAMFDLQDKLADAETRELVLLEALKEIDQLVKSDPDMSGSPRWYFQPSRGGRAELAIKRMKSALQDY